MAVTCKVETITPDIAAEWLEEFNTNNFRTLDQARVENYAKEMLSGWDLNGETIKFLADGSLGDGQHRLWASVESGVTFQSVVIRGISASALHIDRGKPRSTAQWCKHCGIKNATNVAAAARLVIAHDTGLWTLKGIGAGYITDTQVIAFAKQHHEAINGLHGKTPKGVPLSALIAVLFIGGGRVRPANNATVQWFREALATGADLEDTDAVLHLRNRLAGNGSMQLTRHMTRMLLTLAWNKTVAGDSCTANGLRIRMTGPAKTKPPVAISVSDD